MALAAAMAASACLSIFEDKVTCMDALIRARVPFHALAAIPRDAKLLPTLCGRGVLLFS